MKDGPYTAAGIRQYPRKSHIRQSIARASPCAHPSIAFRATIFELSHIRYPLLKSNEDIAFWFKLLENNFVFDNLETVLVEVYQDHDFLRRRGISKAFEEYIVYFKGIHRLRLGWYNMLWPCVRLLVRLLPGQSLIYRLTYLRNLLVRGFFEPIESGHRH